MLNKLYLFLLIVCIGCSDSKNHEAKNNNDPTKESSSVSISQSLGETLSPETRKLVDPWEEYTRMEQHITDYYNISVEEALLNTETLADLTQQLKDSIRVERFQRPDVKIRLNILNNTALRLKDLNQIAQVDDEEIKEEVSNLLTVFSSINTKLNTIVRQEQLEKELKDFN